MAGESSRPTVRTPPRMQPFWDAAGDGRLSVQRCRACAATYFPAVDICNGCLGNELEWVTTSGTGTVFSFAVMHHVYHPAFADRVPYAVVDVQLDDGPRMITTVVDCEPASLRIGMAVEVDFERLDDGRALPVFRVRNGSV